MKYAILLSTAASAMLLSSAPPLSADEAKPAKTPVGRAIENFTLKDYRGKSHSLNDFQQSKVVVVAFLGTECPLAKLYGHRLGKMHRDYADKGVAFLGVNSNCNDSITEIAAYADKHKIDFPVLKDPGNEVADAFAAARTPEVFVLDEKRVVRYRGRIDDQYGIGYIRDRVGDAYLKDAVESLLAGKPVAKSSVKAEGCLIARVLEPNADSKATYSKHVAPILQNRCVDCHRSGEIAPFSLTSYKDVYGWAEMIREVIHDRRMPPWHADPKHGKFANDCSMTKDEIAVIDEWVKNGAPEGDPGDLPKPKTYTTGWQLPRKPDVVVAMRDKPYEVPAEGLFRRKGSARRGVPYKHFTVDPGFTEDKWIRAAEIIPGNRAVVHHVLVIVNPPGGRNRELGVGGGEFLAGYVPGVRPEPYPEGMAKFVPAGSKLVFQMHYTPIGSKQTDLSKIGLIFADPKDVKQAVVTTRAINTRFKIPPNEANHRVEATTATLPFDVKLLALMPHMHLRGKSFSYEARYKDGKKEMLLDVPNYDFNWQTHYRLAEPKTLPAGTRVHCVAHFDNSKQNLNNPNADRRVTWGDQTWDEMMIGYFDILVPVEAFNAARKAAEKDGGESRIDRLIRRFDDNGDKKLSKDEVPERLKRFFDRLDRNKDGVLTRLELEPITRFLQR